MTQNDRFDKNCLGYVTVTSNKGTTWSKTIHRGLHLVEELESNEQETTTTYMDGANSNEQSNMF